LNLETFITILQNSDNFFDRCGRISPVRLSYLFIFLAAGLFARGASVEFAIAPTSLAQGNFIFAISASPATAGTAFHITIKANAGAMPVDSSAEMDVVHHAASGVPTFGAVVAMPTLTIHKQEALWEIAFVASPELLKETDACLIYSVPVQGLPAIEFYEVKLRDFLKP
jgi:hypothetical protein